MKASTLLLASFILTSIFIYSCSQSNEPDVVIQGQVIDSDLRTPIFNSLVQVTAPQEFGNLFSRTDSTGRYSIELSDIIAVTDVTLLASAPDYTEQSRSLKVAENDEVTGFDFDLVSELDDGGGGPDVPSGPSSGAASIELVEISNETINIAATGGVTSSVFTFVVKDSAGNSIDLNNSIDVEFSITSGPGGGEEVTPTIAQTNAQGRVSATLQSGNSAGVVKIEAKIERTIPKLVPPIITKNGKEIDLLEIHSDGLDVFDQIITHSNQAKQTGSEQTKQKVLPDIIITSSPVAITIHGGFPDLDHFSLTPDSYNFEGYNTNDLRNPLKVILGDEFSNPVKPGTAVYFSTTGGVIQGSGTGNTNEDGAVSVDLISSDPRPNDAITGSGGRPGYATVTATTVDKNETEIQKSINILFSTSKALINTPFPSLSLLPTESLNISYSVTDLNGNPMSPGTTVLIETDGELTLSGATEFELGDELFPGANTTDFSFSVEAPEEFSGTETITMTVTSGRGTVTTQSIIVQGSGGGVEGPSSGAASMQLISVSEPVINIAQTGGISNTAFTFQVQDSAGRNLDANNSIDVTFSILSGPGGGENITPITASTNAQGRVTSNLQSGTLAGVVQIQAQIQRPDVGLTITSTPVAITIHGGFPDLDHFSLTPDSYNFEGYNTNDLRNPLKVILGDEFSNPVKPGTAVYFSTTGGVIQGSGTGNTNEDGAVSVDLISSDPRPNDAITGSGGRPGYATVTATTVDKNETEIQKSINILFSTSKALINTPFPSLSLLPTESLNISYSVTDLNGNPMSPGTTVLIETDGELTLSGATEFELGDELFPGANTTDFSFSVEAPEEFSGTETITMTVTSGQGTVTTQSIIVQGSGGGVSGPASGAAAISLISPTGGSIALDIAQSGGITNLPFTFQVQDSAGRNLDDNNSIDVEFSITSGPGGGEFMSPAIVSTNAQGRVTSNLQSGTVAGVVQIQARIQRPDVGLTIVSKPVSVTIHGGFPALSHFNLSLPGNSNIEGFERMGETFTVEAQLGDEFSNPVKQGTAVYFSTNAGIIQGSNEGNTDPNGKVGVQLFTGEPLPVDGRGTVTARTVNKDGTEISKTIDFLFTTSRSTITPELTNLEIGSLESNTIDYTVTDLNGNPMAPGTTIDISTDGSLELLGSTSVILSDETTTGAGKTDFSFTVLGPDGFSGKETITITVTSPSGFISSSTIDVVGVGEGGVTGEPTGAASLILESVQRETINIKETGGIINTSFTFQVQDSAGRPLDLNNATEVEFSILSGPGGGEGIIPATATTNSSGRVTSNLFSGNAAGVVMIQALINRTDIGLILRSRPVAITIHGGFPDLDHFSIRPTTDNFGGYDRNNQRNSIQVIVGDEFSNPVKPGTAVYFTTTGGIIEGSGLGHTDEQGLVSVDLISSDPRPSDATTVGGVNFGGRPGLATITARTVNKDNVLIEKSTNVVFSTNTASISANPTTFDLPPNGGASFSYTVTDLNGNPMPSGTRIRIITGEGMEATGSSDFTLGSFILPGAGSTEFNFSIRDTDDQNNDPADLTVVIEVTAPNGNVTTYDGISGTRRKAIKK